MKIKGLGSIGGATFIILSILFMISGCGGGGGGDTPSSSSGGGTNSAELVGNGVSSGPITAVSDGQTSSAQLQGVSSNTPSGRVQVNGINFETSGARVKRNGAEMPGYLLKIGMVVKLKGHFDEGHREGKATEIEFDDRLNGPVSTIDSANRSLTVLGQKVVVSSTTVFDGVGQLEALTPGTMVEVSGLPDASGNILATRIEKESNPFVPGRTEVELQGTVGSVTGQSFTIGGLTVQSNASLPAGLSAGALVKVEGTLAALSGPLNATEIEVRNAGLGAGNGEIVHLAGFVTNYVSNANFTVNGTVVNAQSLNVTGIGLNVLVQVDGKMVNGVLVATQVIVQDAPSMPAPSPSPPSPAPAPAPSPTPAPAPAPPPTPAPAPIDGAALYSRNCAGCHGALASSTMRGFTSAQIQAAITSNFGGMGSISLTTAEIQAIAAALNF